jgi:hypothetical protein
MVARSIEPEERLVRMWEMLVATWRTIHCSKRIGTRTDRRRRNVAGRAGYTRGLALRGREGGRCSVDGRRRNEAVFEWSVVEILGRPYRMDAERCPSRRRVDASCVKVGGWYVCGRRVERNVREGERNVDIDGLPPVGKTVDIVDDRERARRAHGGLW